MENKLEKKRRMSKELLKSLELLKCFSSKDSFSDDDNALSGKLLKTMSSPKLIKSENKLPMHNFSDRRRQSKQLKQDALAKSVGKLILPIKEDFSEQLQTPQLENLRVIPHMVETTPLSSKYCIPQKYENSHFSVPLVKNSTYLESTDCSLKLESPPFQIDSTSKFNIQKNTIKISNSEVKTVNKIILKPKNSSKILDSMVILKSKSNKIIDHKGQQGH